MNWRYFTERAVGTPRGGRGSFVFPSFLLEVEPAFVLAARINRSTRRVERVGARELEANSLCPLQNQPNVTNPAAFDRAIREAAKSAGKANGRVGLLVPDPVVRVAVLSFETLPKAKQEVDALVRWRMKELLSFAPEEARFSYQVLHREAQCIELLAMAASNSVLSEYEMLVEQVNGGLALILPATVALLPLLPDTDGAGQLLIHLCSGWMTTVVVAGGRLRSWRTRDLARTASPDLASDVGREAARMEASSRDHLKLDIDRIRFCARPPASQELLSELAQAVSAEIEMLTPEERLAPVIPVEEEGLLRRFGATVAGVVANSGKER